MHEIIMEALVVFVIPLGYVMVMNFPYSWLERQTDFNQEDRGRWTGWSPLPDTGAGGGPGLKISGGAAATAPQRRRDGAKKRKKTVRKLQNGRKP